MIDYIENELACIRATESLGSDRYNELSKAINWLEQYRSKEDNSIADDKKHKYAYTTIKWKEDDVEEDVIIKLVPFNEDDENSYEDEQIFYYCEDENEFEELKHYDNGADFVVVGCTLFTKALI